MKTVVIAVPTKQTNVTYYEDYRVQIENILMKNDEGGICFYK